MRKINWYVVNSLVLLPIVGFILESLAKERIVVFYIGIVTGLFLVLGFQHIYYKKKGNIFK
jgi:hypothetical protein